MNGQRPRTAVDDEHVGQWKEAAVRIRFLQQLFARLPDPAEDSPIAEDDLQSYGGEYLSDAVRSALIAALDNMHLWANTVSPPVFIAGHPVENPQRPYFTLARAGLESAAQAAWILAPETTDERVDRHLRLAVGNLTEMAKAMRHSDTDLETYVQKRIIRITTAHPRPIKREPSYVEMIRDVGPAVGCAADDAETLWRIASAAAHGKLWFTGATHVEVVEEQFAPGRFRARHVPDATRITEMITLATRVTQWSELRYGKLIGADLEPICTQAFAVVEANMPRVVRPAGEDSAGVDHARGD